MSRWPLVIAAALALAAGPALRSEDAAPPPPAPVLAPPRAPESDPASARVEAPRSGPVPAPVVAPEAAATTDPSVVTVTGKYGGLVGDQIELVDDPTRFILRDPSLLRRVLQMRSRRDNVRIVGRHAGAAGGGTFEVESVELAPSDAELYRAEIGMAPGSPGAVRSRAIMDVLVRMARAQARIPDPEVAAALGDATKDALRGAGAGVGPQDLPTFLAQVRAMHELTGDRELIFHLLVDLDASFPAEERVVAFLRALGSRRHSGRWVTYEEFKRLEGFVLHEGKWMKEGERDFVLTVTEFHRGRQAGQVLRRRTEREYRLLADRGSVDVGMRPEEVYRSIGPPDRVERRGYAQKEFDQWIYGSRYYYFFDGLLVKAPDR